MKTQTSRKVFFEGNMQSHVYPTDICNWLSCGRGEVWGRGSLEVGKDCHFVSNQIYVLRSSGISRKSVALIVRYRQKKECISFVFYCFENLSIAIHWSNSGGVFSKMHLSSWGLQSNRKLKMSLVWLRLLPLDRITYVTDFPEATFECREGGL